MLWKPEEPTPEEIEQNRTYYLERQALYREYGYDRELAVNFVIDAAGEIKPPVLDVGTGKGFTSLELARRGFPVTSVDISEEWMRGAFLIAKAAGVDDLIDFHIADANELPFSNETFNLVTFVNAIHHMEDFSGALREIARVLKPGGRLLVTELTDEGFAILDRIHESEGRVHERDSRHTIDDVAAVLPGVGLACRGRDVRFNQSLMIAEKL
jgi:ubiquinone/menaquinone biosynthesis C-methylase UbiE